MASHGADYTLERYSTPRMSARIVVGVLAVVVCAGASVFAVVRDTVSTKPSVAEAAGKAITECASATDKGLCYERVVPEFMDEGLSMEDAFAIAAKVQDLDPTYTYCHVLAHNISAKETAKDPDKWKDVVARAPYGVCGNGGSHGAFQERFREESLPNASINEILELISDVCNRRESWDPTPSEVANCVHGVGHLVMYVTGGNINKSNAVCTAFAEHIPNKDDVRTCYEGVFMQVFQPIEPEDKALVENIAPKPSEARAFCDAFTGRIRAICIRESWILTPDSLVEKDIFEAFCAAIEDAHERTYCIEGITMGVFSRSFNFDESRMMPLCEQLSPDMRGICFDTVAFRLLQTDWRNVDRATQVCMKAPSEISGECFTQLSLYAKNAFGTNDPVREQLCNRMPERHRTECAAL